MKVTISTTHSHIGSSLLVVLLWSMLSTLALGLTVTLGVLSVLICTAAWLFSAPACTLAATLGPPPVRKLRGLPPQPVSNSRLLKTKGSHREDSDWPPHDVSHFSFVIVHQKS